MQKAGDTILDIKDLALHFPLRRGAWGRITGYARAVNGVSFSVREGEVLGLVGESGCGKTSTGRSILRLYKPTAGEIWFRTAAGERVEISSLGRRAMKPLRREMRMIFQDPFSSLNPRQTVKDIIGEPLIIHRLARGRELEQRVAELMTDVGLDPDTMGRYPHEFSGGQRQRIGIARTLAVRPRLIVADEPVSALDVSVQAQVLNLLQELKDRFGLTLIFIAHDLAVVEHLCDRIAVMYGGRIVELAPTNALLTHPRHPYTEALISAVPAADPGIRNKRILLEGEVPNPADLPPGCIFHPRCPYAQLRCAAETPPPVEREFGGSVACMRAEELQLAGAAGGSRETGRVPEERMESSRL
jgi:oligopeptide/dipeptide ABC transporter ATP-binding protein